NPPLLCRVRCVILTLNVEFGQEKAECLLSASPQRRDAVRPLPQRSNAMKEYMQRPETESDGMIEGRNAVTEALRSGTAIDKIYLAKGETDRTLSRIASEARKAGVVVVEADRRKLDAM